MDVSARGLGPVVKIQHRNQFGQQVAPDVCPWNHPYAGANLGTARNGSHFCRHCKRVSVRGSRRGGLTMEQCYALYPEWLKLP
jgi:hypothetical protein